MAAELESVMECNDGVIRVETVCRICGQREEYELSGEFAERAAEVMKKMEPICGRCHEERQRREEMAGQIESLTLAAGVPENFIRWDKSIGNNTLLKFCFDALGKWAFIADEVDRGKTRAVCRAVKEFYRRDPLKKAEYWNLNELAEQFTAAVSQRYYQGNALQRSLEALDFLILDDLGKKGRYSEAVTSLLYDLANTMYSKGGTLWIVANRRFSECGEYFADLDVFEAIYSRFGRMKNAGKYAGWNFGEVER